ncbi:carbohydrate sulfotransferase 10 isoform X1 [Tachysurus fulvidraco]|uniref:carbohydrate sulfotransferase 10 isoform X1 n=1 Tax=Tachysurus fulvidraco TaxID=1234273 RepID=UPI000F4F7D87|nr:carbohydrate sulfotransferase 10 isoform X1 [Tachysurus fulvidraco]
MYYYFFMAKRRSLFFIHERLRQHLHGPMMRRHWLLVGACGWVLLILMFVSKFINFSLRMPEDYGGRPMLLNWTSLTVKTVNPVNQLSQNAASQPPAVSSGGPTQVELSDWESVTVQRLQLLSSVCKNSSLWKLSHTPLRKFILDRIFVCDKHKILFCQTPKVGNTQWKKVLIVLNGKFSKVEDIPENVVHDHERNGLPRLSSMSDTEITERLKTYFKFFIVRDPFERLISAFKDKFVENPRFEPWYKHSIAPTIIRKYRKSHRDTSGSAGLHFEDFVRYLGDESGRKHLDHQFGEHVIHWLTYVELCAPCDITYDVIGHHETLEQDAPYILKAAGIEDLVTYPSIPKGITLYNRTKVEHYFSGISKRDIRRLYACYQGDFSLFGYHRPDFLLD